ncbi:MAG: FKBP-type peptidyl-prolyl cis-trans isomerase [Lachnospiraceae bacterium]|nr:FKBP-type peptidyl-prolyl cis-trans isomerase [Lachnospiraceae bacterium]
MKKNKKMIIMAVVAVVLVAVIVVYTMVDWESVFKTADTGEEQTVEESTDSSGTEETSSSSLVLDTETETETATEFDSENPSASSALVITVTDGSYTSLADYPVEDYVTLGEYIGLELSVAAQEEVDEETVTALAESYFESLAADYAAELTEGQLVEEGDTANIDYTGYLNGEAFDGGSATGYDLEIGSGAFIDGFEEGLIGVAVGDTVDLELTFPSDYSSNPSLAGQAVVFTVTVNYVTPQMTDENVAIVMEGYYSTVEELEAYCRSYLEYVAAYNYQSNLDSAVIEAVVPICTVTEVPDYLYNMLYQNLVDSIETQAAQYGLDGDTYCSYFVGYSMSEYALLMADEYAPEVMIFQAIANEQELNPTEEELDEQAELYMTYYGYESLEDLYENYISRDNLELYLMQVNVADFLAENAVITETDETE